MSKLSLETKVSFILSMISNIEVIIQRHNGLVNALSDDIEARPAILLSLMQLGENLNKIEAEILDKYDLISDAKGAYNVRNFIAHDYEGVDLGLVEVIIRQNIPKLKGKIQNLKICELEK